MKRTFKRPDGTEETVEGTAEELAEYERRLREDKPRANESKKRPVLHGRDLEEIARVVRDQIRAEGPKHVWWPTTVTYPTIVMPTRCWVCGQENCGQTHIVCQGETTTVGSSAVDASVMRTFGLLPD